MARLFLSLYLFIAVALIGLSSSLEAVFFSANEKASPALDNLTALLQSLDTETTNVPDFLQAAGLNVNVVDMHAIGWRDEDVDLLKAGKVVSLYDPHLGQQLYLAISPQQLVELSLGAPDNEGSSFILYSAVFFILLGMLLAIWVWPLWRDLSRLKAAAGRLDNQGAVEKVVLGKGSLIRPIADALNSMHTQVKQLLQTQRELTGAVAHEFRTPLSRLKFALAVQPEPGSSPWQAMNHDLDELEKLVQEMLDFTSMESQVPELNMSDIPLQALTKILVEELPKDAKTDLDIGIGGETCHVIADSHYLERALQNLLLNATRYAANRIEVSIQQFDDVVQIAVEDDGPGVPMPIRDKIFEPFFRPDDGRDRKRGGAGLGLAIVKRIVHWLDGKCWVESSELGGARFVIQLKAS